jgi:hypothetical protein
MALGVWRMIERVQIDIPGKLPAIGRAQQQDDATSKAPFDLKGEGAQARVRVRAQADLRLPPSNFVAAVRRH